MNESDLSDQDFFYAYLSEYLNGELSPSLYGRFATLAGSESFKPKLDLFQIRLRDFQHSLHTVVVDENEFVLLQEKIRSKESYTTREMVEVKKVEQNEIKFKYIRWSVLCALVLGLFGFLYYLFSPTKNAEFNTLQVLAYEALAIEQDDDRLDLPSKDFDEIFEYFDNYPNLDFDVKVLVIGEGWQYEGASIIDYEVAKVSLVQFSSAELGQSLMHFSLAGALSDLAQAKQGQLSSLVYQVYASDRMNMIAWENTDSSVLSILAGRLSSDALAKIAIKGLGLKQ